MRENQEKYDEDLKIHCKAKEEYSVSEQRTKSAT